MYSALLTHRCLSKDDVRRPQVSDVLKLLEFLSPEAISTFVVYCNARRHNPSTQRVAHSQSIDVCLIFTAQITNEDFRDKRVNNEIVYQTIVR